MKFKLARFFYRIMLWWLPLWSKVYRFFGQPKRKYTKTPLEFGHSPQSAYSRLKLLEWRKDDWNVLKDVVNRPEHVQMSLKCAELFGYQPDGQMDCDDFAIWAANTMSRSWHPLFLCVSWQCKDGTLGGHAVCVAQEHSTGKFYHVGNWGVHGPFMEFKDVIEEILELVDSRLIGWGLFSPDLKLLKWSKHIPN